LKIGFFVVLFERFENLVGFRRLAESREKQSSQNIGFGKNEVSVHVIFQQYIFYDYKL
jgi:hypothetical protein